MGITTTLEGHMVEPNERAGPTSTPDLLEAQFRSSYRRLVGLAAHLSSPALAEEIVQDAFVAVFGRLHRVPADKLDVYLRRAVVNRARSSLRRKRVRAKYPLEVPRDEPAAERDALRHLNAAAMVDRLGELPARQREVLVLRYYADLSEREIAQTLGVSRGSVKTHAHRGLTTLGIQLTATDDNDEEDR